MTNLILRHMEFPNTDIKLIIRGNSSLPEKYISTSCYLPLPIQAMFHFLLWHKAMEAYLKMNPPKILHCIH